MQVEVKKEKEEPSTKRILVVDDDESIRQMLDMTLTAEGFMVKTARDGRNIHEATGPFSPHLIITDLMMPGSGGYELARTLQSDPTTSKTPVLVMSGANLDASTKKMLEAEPNVRGFITKPLQPYGFLNQVHKILNTKSKEEKMLDQRFKEMKQFEPKKYDF